MKVSRLRDDLISAKRRIHSQFSIFNYQFFQGDSLMIEVTKPRAIALGYFDGVHLGHRALMQRAVERAKQIGGTSAVFTFDVHPDSVVMGRQVPLLTANAYRTEEIKKLGGVDEVIFGHFDHEMQHMDWRDFIHKLLIGRFNAGWIISGRNNRFGYKGQGNAEGMAIECEKAGIGYDCIEDVKIDALWCPPPIFVS